MSEAEAKRRKPNWNKDEVLLLTELVKTNASVLEGKFGPGVTSAKSNRQEAWQVITATLNSSGLHPRTKEGVEKKWKNIKSRSKQKYSDFSRMTKGTAGGPAPTPVSPVTNAGIDILGQDNVALTGVPGSLDSTMLQVLDFVPTDDRQIYAAVCDPHPQPEGATVGPEEPPAIHHNATGRPTVEALLKQKLQLEIECLNLKKEYLKQKIMKLN
ncbi:myb-related transcription factor, partner of profilin-like [Haliotis asinina]|uniref:myb-related transcription factor, partner of profilin-like n=1 Tax=Haliotis asinina TaxID=109174 RepID=UPI003531C6BF